MKLIKSVTNRKFGIEIECAFPEAKLFVLDPLKKKEWFEKRDCSIRTSHRSSVPLEFVSPILSGQEGLNQVKEAIQLIRSAGGEMNPSCGQHVHVDARDLNQEQLFLVAYIYNNWASQIEKIISPWRRQNRNRYCIHMRKEEILDRAYGARGTVNLHAFQKHGTIEFRQLHGTLDSRISRRWIQFCTNLVERVSKISPKEERVTTLSYKKIKDIFAKFSGSDHGRELLHKKSLHVSSITNAERQMLGMLVAQKAFRTIRGDNVYFRGTQIDWFCADCPDPVKVLKNSGRCKQKGDKIVIFQWKLEELAFNPFYGLPKATIEFFEHRNQYYLTRWPRKENFLRQYPNGLD